MPNSPALSAGSASCAATTAGKLGTNTHANADLKDHEVLWMGQVAVTIKVFPENPEKLEEVKEAVKKIVNVAKIGEEPIGFGLVAAIITFVMEM